MRILDTRHTPNRCLSAGAMTVLAVTALIALPSLRAQAPKAPERQTEPPAAVPAPTGGERTLEFRVVDSRTGKPMPGVQLRIRIEDDLSDARTDETGLYVIRKIPAKVAGALAVWVEHDGFAPQSISWRNEAANSGLPAMCTLKMVPAITIGGVIQDEQGKPIEGATVFVRANSGGGSGEGVPMTHIFEYPAPTDAQGRWKCNVIPDGADYVSTRLVHPDYVSDRFYEDTPDPPLDELRARTAVMVMKRGVTLSGTVRDNNNKPVAGARVKLGVDRWGSPHPPDTETDAEGRYRFQVAPGSHVVTVVARGYAPDLRHLPAVQRTEQADFVLAPARTLRGRTFDPQGRPVAGVGLAADTWRGYRTLEDQRFKSDTQGQFVWTEAPADVVQFAVHRQGYMYLLPHPMTASDQEVIVTMAPLLRVHGSVVDAETGRRIEAFRVIPGITINQPYWMYDRAVAATGGRYEITCDDTRSPQVRIEAVGYHPAVSPVFEGDFGDQVFNALLSKAKAPANIVRLPDGTPLAGAEVILATRSATPTINNGRMYQRGRSPIVQTDSNGHFALPTPDEDYAVVVLHERGIAQRSARQLAAEPDITVRPWGRIEGVLKVGGKPGARQSITGNTRFSSPALPPEPHYLYHADADDEGRFVLDRVIPGEFFVAGVLRMPQGTTTASGNGIYVDVQPGETLQVNLGGTGRPVIGRVVLPKGSNAQIDWTYGHCQFHNEPERPTPPRRVEPGGGSALVARFRPSEGLSEGPPSVPVQRRTRRVVSCRRRSRRQVSPVHPGEQSSVGRRPYQRSAARDCRPRL